MIWKPIDFEKIVSLDSSIFTQFTEFLENKETDLANAIFDAFQLSPADFPELMNKDNHLEINEAIDSIGKKIRLLPLHTMKTQTGKNWTSLTVSINNALWGYIEILEESITELFQQIEQIGFEKWSVSLMQIVESFEEFLKDRIEAVIWSIRRLEKILKDYRKKCEKQQIGWNFLYRLFVNSKSILDTSLEKNLKKSEQVLTKSFLDFSNSFLSYGKLNKKVQEDAHKLRGYLVLSQLDEENRDRYINIYRFLKLNELNEETKILPSYQTRNLLTNIATPTIVLNVFAHYLEALFNALFEDSRELKLIQDTTEIEKTKKSVSQLLPFYKKEWQTLMTTFSRYEFFLEEDNEKKFSLLEFLRSYFSEKKNEQEEQAQNGFKEALERYGNILEQFTDEIGKESTTMNRFKQTHDYTEIQKILHEMTQPLISKMSMITYIDSLLLSSRELQELASSDPEIVDYMNDILSAILRLDWKYLVCFDNPLFYEIFHIHEGILDMPEERASTIRREKVKDLLMQLEEWVAEGSTQSHISEIEHDVNDIRSYLQDFLGSIQRIIREYKDKPEYKEALRSQAAQLLDYRFFFGKFFYFLEDSGSHGKNLHRNMLFVHQYFESMENLLKDWKKTRHLMD